MQQQAYSRCPEAHFFAVLPVSTLLQWLLAFTLVLGVFSNAQAAYVQVYNTIQKGAITFTGNTLGLNSRTVSGQSAVFIAAGLSTGVAGFPVGTSTSYAQSLSRAQLNIPAGATVLHAELIWVGKTGGTVTPTTLSTTNVTFITPLGTYSVAPSVSTAANSSNSYSTRSANVTGIIQLGGSGTYSVGGVPAIVNTSSTDGSGWTLAVAYADASKPARNLTIFVGSEPSGGASAAVSGFCTPTLGPISARLAVSGIEGDSSGVGDTMLFGKNSVLSTTTDRVSDSNNPIGNFFASQINGDLGFLDTSGTFGTLNHTPGANTFGARQAYDITNVDVSSRLVNSQTTAYAQGTTAGDVYAIDAIGLQINVNSPIFPVTVKTVNKIATFVGDQLIYSIDLDNRAGNGAATGVKFFDTLPSGTSLVPGSVMVDTNPPQPNNPNVQTGTVQAASDLNTGLTIGTVGVGSVVRVSFRVNVTGLPASPTPAKYDNAARWDYTYTACAGTADQTGSVITGTVTTTAARLEPTKTVSPTGALVGGQTATYTITIPNTGLLNTSGTTLADPIPAGTTYVAGSTKLNGVAITDGAGGIMPFATAAPVNSTGQSAGVIAFGVSATVQFGVIATSGATVNNLASIDPDGPGIGPAITVSAVNSGLDGPSVSKAFAPTSIGAGGTSTLTVTLTNPNATTIAGVSVTDNLPGGMTIANPANMATTCTGGTVTNAAISLTLAGASIPASGSCTFSAKVTVSTAGSYVNTIPAGAVTSSNAGANTAGIQTLTATAAPAINKSFSPGTVAPNAASTLTITLTNPGTTALTGVGFTDTLPTTPGAMTILNTTTSNTCGGTLTAAVGSDSVSLSGGTITAQNVCTITVQVKAPTGGSYINTIPVGAMTTSGGANTVAASGTLQIASPQVTKSFAPAKVATATNSLMTVTLTNVSSAAITGLAFTDTYPTGLVNNTAVTNTGCGGTATANAAGTNPGILTLTGGTLAAGSSCTLTVNVRSATAGSYTNTIAAGAVSSSIGPNAVSASATLDVARPNITKAFSAETMSLNGTATLTITLTNPTATAMTNAAFTDTLPSGLTASVAGGTCAGTKAASGATVSLTGGTIPTGATGCTVTATVTGTSIGGKVNTIPVGALTVTGGGSNGTATTDDITVLGNPTVTKSFLTSPILPTTGVSTLRIVLENPTPSILTGATFVDTFPTTPGAMTIADLTTTNTCGGTLVNNLNTALAIGSAGIRLNTGTIPALDSCVIQINVKASAAGDYTNTIPASPTVGFLSTTEAGGNSVAATAPLAVRLTAPTVAKSFSPTTIVANDATTLTLTLTNPSTTQAITGVVFSDIFPAGMNVFSTPAFTNSCGGTVTAGTAANDTSIAISGATIPSAGNCVISVKVTSTIVAASPGLANTTSTVTSTNANTSTTATANLIVTAPPVISPTIVKSFTPASISSGGISTLRFAIGSANTGILHNANFTDTLTNMTVSSVTLGPGCASVTNSPPLVVGATALNFTIPNLPPGGCNVDVQVTSTTVGSHPNSVSGVTTTETPTAGAGSGPVNLTVTLGAAKVTVHKISVGGIDTFSFKGNNGLPTTFTNVTTVTAGTPATVAALTDVSVTALNTLTTITEGTLPPDYVLTGASCTGLNGTDKVALDTTLRVLNIPATSIIGGAVIDCTFTNTKVGTNTVTGTVFKDTGTSGGTANDGIQNGAETGLAGVVVKLTNCASTVYNTTTTNGAGGYTFPTSVATLGTVCVETTNLSGYASTDANVAGDTTPSGFTVVNADKISFTLAASTSYSSLNFGDAPASQFLTDGIKTGIAGSILYYQHTFTAGAGGAVTFSLPGATDSPALSGWNESLYTDTDCDGIIDIGESLTGTGAIPVAVGDQICLIMKEFVPPGAPLGATNLVPVKASFAYTGASSIPPTLYTRQDLTTVSSASVDLKKAVRNVTLDGVGAPNWQVSNTAKAGETLEYRIIYTNNGTSPISALVVNDTTPAYTTFVSASAGTLPPSLLTCTKTTPTATAVSCSSFDTPGGTGGVEFKFTGSLAPSSSGAVTFKVKLD